MKHAAFLVMSALLIIVGSSPPSLAVPAAKISELSWMTGSYEGPIGQGALEENWAEPKGGSIASLVRATGADGATTMIELIVVEEEEDCLTLRLQQRNPGFKPRSAEPQVMRLVELKSGKVVFDNIGEGGITRLSHTKSGKKFTITVQRPNGTSRDIELTPK